MDRMMDNLMAAPPEWAPEWPQECKARPCRAECIHQWRRALRNLHVRHNHHSRLSHRKCGGPVLRVCPAKAVPQHLAAAADQAAG